MFCVLRILHRCVFRSKSFHGFPGALPDKSGSSGDCQTLQIFFGSVGRCLWNLPVFLVFKRNQYGEHTHFFSWDLLCDGPAGLRFPQREVTAFRSRRLLWHVFYAGRDFTCAASRDRKRNPDFFYNHIYRLLDFKHRHKTL